MRVFALLAGEPWRLGRREALACSRRWLYEVLCHPRDREGRLLTPQAPGRNRREELTALARRRGWPEHRIPEWVRTHLGE